MELMKLLNNDLEGLNEEEKAFAEEFNTKLRNNIINELVVYEGDELTNKFNTSKEDYYEALGQILINGIKGYKNLTMKQLIDIYLTKKRDEDFIKLIEKLS